MSFKSSSSSGDLGYNGFPVSLSYFVAAPEVLVIQDPNIAVLFKALSKKNSVTKEKNLSDLVKVFNDTSCTITDSVIMCWIQQYPKLALDNSKPVRLLAHQVQGNLLRRVGGKEFGKYLKSTIPLWLLSLYDPDSPVANGSYRELLESFNNEKERVDTKLWHVFCEQIINFIHTIICVESDESLSDLRYVKKEDSVAKYERALVGAVSMLRKLVDMRNHDTSFVLTDESKKQVEDILHLEELWGPLASCSDSETINVGLFKTYLALIKAIFNLNENHPFPFTTALEDVKGLYKLVSKKFIKNVKLKETEKTQSLVYSNVIIQFWDTLNVLTSFSSMDADDNKSLKIKKNFWELAGSKAHSRLMDYIKLGPCNSDPIFYNVLKAFFKNASRVEYKAESDDTFLDFASNKHIKSVNKALLSQFSKLNTLLYKKSAIGCIFTLLSLSSAKSTPELKMEAYLTALDGLSARSRQADASTKNEAIELLASNCENLKFDEMGEEICEYITSSGTFSLAGHSFKSEFDHVVPTYVATLNVEQSNKLADSVLLALLDIFEIPQQTKAFEVLICCFQKGFSQETKEWMPLLPSFCTPNFTRLPFEVLRLVLKSNVDWIDYQELISDVFTKVSTDVKSALPELLKILKQTETISEKDIPEVKEYLESLSAANTDSSQGNDMVYNYIDDPTILRNLIISPAVRANPNQFIDATITKKINLRNLESDLQGSISEIILQGLTTLDVSRLASFLELIGDVPFIARTLYSGMEKSDSKFEKVTNFLSQFPKYFPMKEISERVSKATGLVDITTVAISNPIFQNVHLASQSTEDPILDGFVVGTAKLLASHLDSAQSSATDSIAVAILVSEYIDDYLFLAKSNPSMLSILNDKAELDTSIKRHVFVSSSNPADFLNGQIEDSSIESHLLNVISAEGPFNKSQIFFARYVTRHLATSFEVMSFKEFESLDLKLTKLARQPLLLASFLSSATKFTGVSKKFDRLRSFVFAEILGVKSSLDILDLGKTWLSLAINFLNVDHNESPQYEVLPPHKMGLLVNHISEWLDSDIAYDDDFHVIRSLLALFFSSLLAEHSNSVSEKCWEVAYDLCLNNLSTAQLAVSNIELRFFTIKLAATLLKSADEQGDWKETRKSLIEEICDLILNQEVERNDEQRDNQAITMTNEIVRRIMSGHCVPDYLIADNLEKFYKIVHNSTFVDMQRVSTMLLQRHILSTRDEFVVEYQLNKSNLGDSLENLAEAKLPEQLINSVAEFGEDLETSIGRERDHIVTSYLWSWLLIFAFFKDSTYGIRTDYINQLKEHKSIEHLLNVIFDHVDIADSKFLKTLVDGNLENTNRVDPENCKISEYSVATGCVGEDLLYEMKFLLVHLYLMCLQYLGSHSQQWFSELRDLQLKRQIEKFSVKFICPILTSRMLSEVESTKRKLTDKDENLSIKVNQVTNEIKTIYLIDEQRMEMVVKIPESFPLSSVLVLGPLRLGVKENQWKAWLLASQRVISLTNGSITDCIELFNRNVNLHFSGFEECAICYSILHQDHSLPSKTCPTCLNKFHAACLYKWFKSSGSSTCPLCRTAFNFSRASRA